MEASSQVRSVLACCVLPRCTAARPIARMPVVKLRVGTHQAGGIDTFTFLPHRNGTLCAVVGGVHYNSDMYRYPSLELTKAI